MMRGAVAGLENPHHLGGALPALFQEDDFAQRLTGGLDEVLAPIISTLDNLDAYLDPDLTPADFVGWLAHWIGLALDENWPLEMQRRLVAQAGELYRWRGTLRGLRHHVALYTGTEPEISDSGGCRWSITPRSDPPGAPEASVTVRVRLEDHSAEDGPRLDALVAAAKPAHVVHSIEVVEP
jgi:phage tail-like protein